MVKERSLSKKTFIITGGNTGLGYECAKNITKYDKNNQIVIACRNATRAKEAVNSLIRETGNDNIISLELDLSSLQSVRNFVTQFLNSQLPLLYAIEIGRAHV